jgi:enterochelin esterase-like enzyme
MVRRGRLHAAPARGVSATSTTTSPRVTQVTAPVPFRALPVDLDDVRYSHGPDSHRRADVPVGHVESWTWADSTVYPGTTRTVWTYVPAQYDPDRSAAPMIFNDGWWYLDPDGEVRGAIVLDNLVHRGAIPVTIGVFVDPGVLVDPATGARTKNRNAEYDAFDDRYATFLLEEIVPQVSRRYALTDDPGQWGVCGGSSGGNAAFTVAWMRPDRIRRAICFLSSFTQMPGGNPYPELIPVTDPKPLRIFLQAGHRDLHWNGPRMNWLAHNLRVAAALVEAGYDAHLVLGDGGHSPNHGGVLLPDALRWSLRADQDDAAHRSAP